jgi:hypothetical protein
MRRFHLRREQRDNDRHCAHLVKKRFGQELAAVATLDMPLRFLR